jgi:hypothetical protein
MHPWSRYTAWRVNASFCQCFMSCCPDFLRGSTLCLRDLSRGQEFLSPVDYPGLLDHIRKICRVVFESVESSSDIPSELRLNLILSKAARLFNSAHAATLNAKTPLFHQ